jgi:transposase InsO family protein
MPFPVEAIKVGGSSEFKAESEEACQARDPPVRTAARPTADQWRARALVWIMRYEFYACYDLPAPSKPSVQYSKSLQHIYNRYRPHGALAGQTPASYLKER